MRNVKFCETIRTMEVKNEGISTNQSKEGRGRGGIEKKTIFDVYGV
jgi:hypothetical protein